MARKSKFDTAKRRKRLRKQEQKEVKAIVRKELDSRVMDNYFHGHFPPASISSLPAGTPIQLATMAVGDSIGQRNGTGVMVKRLQATVKLSNVSTATPADYIGRDVRFIICRVYKADPAFQPNFNLIFGNGTGATSALQYPKIQERLGNNKEITILYDKVVNLHPGLGDQRILKIDKKYKRPTGVYYDGSNRNSGQFWANVIFSSGSGTAPPAIEMTWKLTYEDA